MEKIIVLGGGSWGTALAHVLASAKHKVTLIMRDEKNAEAINQTHINSKYLAGQKLNSNIFATCDYNYLQDCTHLILAIPCQSLRAELQKNKSLLAQNKHLTIIQSAKGIELSSLKIMYTLVCEELDGINFEYSTLSGPSFALETVQNKPTAVVLACKNDETGKALRSLFATDFFRAYSSNDIAGVEIGGAMKNVIAIACGLSDGLGFGLNARAALMTRGLAEISRLGKAMGANPATFMGLSGMGDLFLTCSGDLSRNRQVGLKLAQGQNLSEIIASMNMVAEGVKTTEAVSELANKLNIEMPIAQSVQKILKNELTAQAGVIALMTRTTKHELE